MSNKNKIVTDKIPLRAFLDVDGHLVWVEECRAHDVEHMIACGYTRVQRLDGYFQFGDTHD